MAVIRDLDQIKKTPTIFVIFGATGDLATKKLFPALLELHNANYLPEQFKIIAASRSSQSSKEFRNQLKDSLNPKDNKSWDTFASNIDFIQADVAENNNLGNITSHIKNTEKEIQECAKVIIYLAIAPSIYKQAFENLGKIKLNFGCATHSNKSRIVIEKPFGHDYASAHSLHETLTNNFDNDQIYRIDHFLGKETVQNILALRFGNEIFEPLLNNHYVDNIQITFTENIGIEKRGGFYEETGALRDVVQNHLFQLLALATMEAPKTLTHNDFRDRRLEITENIKKMSPNEVKKNTIRAQYEGYRKEKNVNPDSQTETYALVKLFIENNRWKNVPIYIRTGKMLTANVASIIYSIKEKGHAMFENFWDKPLPNHITIQIKPTEGIGIRLVAKKPGFAQELEPVDMEFCYRNSFANHNPDAYERLLMDVILGDQTLFLGKVGPSWKVIDPIRKVWNSGKPALATYKQRSWGPTEADEFMKKEGREWLAPYLTICKI